MWGSVPLCRSGSVRDAVSGVGLDCLREALGPDLSHAPAAPSRPQTKKRYVGHAYESPKQSSPIFDAKGIETVRRDSCPAVAKILESSLRLIFDTKDLSEVKAFLARQFSRILHGRVNLQVRPRRIGCCVGTTVLAPS